MLLHFFIINKFKDTNNELLKSGVLEQRSDFLSMFNAQTGSVKGTVPIYGLLDGKPTNYDGNTDIAASTTTTYSQEVVCIGRAKGFTEMDFSEDVTGGVDFITWLRKWQNIGMESTKTYY